MNRRLSFRAMRERGPAAFPLRAACGRAVACLALLALLMTGGCIYSRLLTLKHQLARFDEYVEVRDGSGLTLVFREPVVLPSDIVRVSGLRPTQVRTNAGREEWEYVYVSESPAAGTAAPPLTLPFLLRFGGGRLSEFYWPGTNVAQLGRDFFASAARAIGRARFTQRDYIMNWGAGDTNTAGAAGFSLDGIVRFFGPELRRTGTDSAIGLEYQFRLLPNEAERGGAPTIIRADLTFAADSGLLQTATVTAGRIRFQIACPKPP